MKKLILLLIIAISSSTFSQIFEPVKWATSVEKVSETEYILIANASIDNKWHLYSQDVPENGPIATTFTFEEKENYSLVGNVIEDEGHTVNDPVFNMVIKFFENNATFKQKIKILDNKISIIKGEVEFMVCDDTRCLPPTYVDLEFDLSKATNVIDTANSSISNNSISSLTNNSQLVDPVKWKTSVEKVSETEFVLISEAVIENKWHLYSQKVLENGPIETAFEYQTPVKSKLIGSTIESEGITSMDPIFEMEITYFENSNLPLQRYDD